MSADTPVLPGATSLHEERSPPQSQAQLAGKGKAGRAGKVGHGQDGLMKGKPRCRRSLLSVGESETQAGAVGGTRNI